MLSSLNNRFCKPRVIFVGLEIGNTRQRRLFSFPLSLSARENCENETTVPGKRGRGRWRKEKRWKREKLIKKRERERRMDKERAAQWNVYCPRCGPLAGYIRAHPPFARHAIKWSLVCELTRCKRARGKRSTPSPAVTAPDTAHVRGACATVAKLSASKLWISLEGKGEGEGRGCVYASRRGEWKRVPLRDPAIERPIHSTRTLAWFCWDFCDW